MRKHFGRTSGSAGVLDSLYNKHFSSHGSSSVTSSHWRLIGWQSVNKTNDGWSLAGGGFGSRRERTFLNKLLRWFSTLMTYGLLRANNCPQDLLEKGLEVARRHCRLFDYDCARQLLTIALLRQHLELLKSGGAEANFAGTVAIIGDGYGYLGSVFKAIFPKAVVIEINLGRTLFFDAYYLAQAFPQAQHRLMSAGSQPVDGDDFVYVEAECVSTLESLNACLFINIASMQEMDSSVIRAYFKLMRASHEQPAYFYCCNREEKKLPDGTVSRLADYGWLDADAILLDGLCPWHQFYPKSLPPHWAPFDGPTRHRLVRLAPQLD